MIRRLALALQVRGGSERHRIVAVLGLLRRHRGASNPIRAVAIVEQLGLEGRDPERDVQAIVKFLVEERHLPIGTSTRSPYGYFWLTSNKERRAVRDHFVRRAKSNLEHARAFDSDSIVAPLIGQLVIQFPEVS